MSSGKTAAPIPERSQLRCFPKQAAALLKSATRSGVDSSAKLTRALRARSQRQSDRSSCLSSASENQNERLLKPLSTFVSGSWSPPPLASNRRSEEHTSE